jgi:hypothetical protein
MPCRREGGGTKAGASEAETARGWQPRPRHATKAQSATSLVLVQVNIFFDISINGSETERTRRLEDDAYFSRPVQCSLNSPSLSSGLSALTTTTTTTTTTGRVEVSIQHGARYLLSSVCSHIDLLTRKDVVVYVRGHTTTVLEGTHKLRMATR